MEKIVQFDLNNKNILITGGTGSFGVRCIDTLLRNYKPKKLVILSRDELKQYELSQKYSEKGEINYEI